jgi:hypothetical protein
MRGNEWICGVLVHTLTFHPTVLCVVAAFVAYYCSVLPVEVILSRTANVSGCRATDALWHGGYYWV